ECCRISCKGMEGIHVIPDRREVGPAHRPETELDLRHAEVRPVSDAYLLRKRIHIHVAPFGPLRKQRIPSFDLVARTRVVAGKRTKTGITIGIEGMIESTPKLRKTPPRQKESPAVLSTPLPGIL